MKIKIALIFACFVLIILSYFKLDKNIEFNFISTPNSKTNKQIIKQEFINLKMPDVKSVHSSTSILLNENSLLTAYFAGSKEGARDVKIYANLTNLKTKEQKILVLLDRDKLMKDSKEFIKKLGNPVFVKFNDKIELFVVGVSIGGWATSKIYQYESDVKNIDFKYKTKLHLSPFFNLSNLVRTNAVFLEFKEQKNGNGFLLPIYHELASKFSLALIFDKNANLIKLSKISSLNGTFQPSAVALSKDYVLFAHRSDDRVNYHFFTQICDTALVCTPPYKTNLINHDNSINLFKINKDIFLIYNDSPDNTRKIISLAKMQNQGTFIKLFDFDKGSEMSYASVFVDGEKAHISYTHDREFIKYQQFLFE